MINNFFEGLSYKNTCKEQGIFMMRMSSNVIEKEVTPGKSPKSVEDREKLKELFSWGNSKNKSFVYGNILNILEISHLLILSR